MHETYNNMLKYGYVVSEINGKANCLLTETEYNSLKQCENTEEIAIKLMKYYKHITEDMEMSRVEIRKRLTMTIMDEFNSFLYNEDHILNIILNYYIDYHKIHNFFMLLQSKAVDPELEKSFAKIELGDFDALKTLKFSKDMNDVRKFCVENSFLKKYYYRLEWQTEFKNNNFQLAQALFFKYHIEETYDKLKDYDLFIGEIFKVEADRYIIDLTLNTFKSEDIRGAARKKLYPLIYSMDETTVDALSEVDNHEDLRSIVMNKYNFKDDIFTGLIHREMEIYNESFRVFNDISCVYAYFKLKEQEIRNILWIMECVSMGRRENIDNIIVLKKLVN
ncbi:vacuolar proton pump subunit d 2 [Nosema bombycis CQ1]|uniref:Vacuolar proton pump subunit d 2 n=1 Tax=Nosema bombycis (strain CQ1 / CVCC 102059) TaxID=578461 RepID=R0ML21_NOSB1|nr:vacuolar proton pump subunit d 2 [Nosema bombycis CQ1]|eukprot:EOB14905.1 vacuolar proton pump subunit d 2 [Nosema bombycis CQ1]